MGPGYLVANRFQIEAAAGVGGMATVYKALDRESGERVALKVMRGAGALVPERFAREAGVLAELRHPGVVRYVAHGSVEGQEYLAMEWLEGEDLARRLARAPITFEETLSVGACAARALAAAHARGVVHRDIKPSNLFLSRGDVRDIKLVDFGIAHLEMDWQNELTATGVVLGTPGYMAPEQARGSRNVDGSADIFSLACVLFKCLTGRPPFVADNVIGVLAKILLELPPRLAEVCNNVPEGLDDLVGRMLAKEPEKRPSDQTVFETLERLRESTEPAAASRRPAQTAPALGGTERRVWSVVLVGRAPRSLEAPTIADGGDYTLSDFEAPSVDVLRSIASHHHGHLESLVDGSLLVTIEGTAADMAAHAARCALALRARLIGAPMALATGRAEAHGTLPIGEVTDRAARMLDGGNGQGVRIDDATAGLLDARFEVIGDQQGLELSSEREPMAQPRTLLGRATPFVGRERELATLQGTFEECLAEPLARCVLLSGPAGIGKSRIIHELVPKLEARGAVVWTGRGDVMTRGSMLGLVAPALQREAGVLEGEPAEVRQRKIAARVARHVAPPIRARVTAFLGDLIGANFPDDYTQELQMARSDVVLRGDQIRRAWLDFLEAELAVQPVALVIENLQWGDVASVKLIDLALKNFRAQPWFVIAAARPEVQGAFPDLWKGHDVLQIQELRPRASERLVRAALGDGPSAEQVARMVERAAGNAFYLEEIVRAVADGHGTEALPDTVLATVQARLDVIDGELRRVLRAASVFGQVFWAGGVAALLGAASVRPVHERLAELEDLEIIHRVGAGKFPREPDWTFRHGIVRDAAYAMLTEADRKLGHRLAADWLERAGEREPIILAEHCELGGAEERAVDWYLWAAQQALGGNDFSGALERAERGVRCGATGSKLGELRLVQAEAHKWRGEYAGMAERAVEAERVLPRESDGWFTAIGQIAVATGSLGNLTALIEATQPLFHNKPRSHLQVAAWDRVAAHFATTGRLDLAESLWASLESVANQFDSAWIHRARALKALFAGDPSTYATFSAAAAEAFERAGALSNACQQRSNAGDAMKELGDYATAESMLRKALVEGERMGLTFVVTHAKLNLVSVLARTDKAEEAVAVAATAIEEGRAQSHTRFECAARIFLVTAHQNAGDLDAALVAARQATQFARDFVPSWVPYALASLASVELALGHARPALDSAREAMERFQSLGALEEGESLVRLVYAQALEANGNRSAAREAIADAKRALLERAEKIGDARYRAMFLENIWEHARTMELAEPT